MVDKEYIEREAALQHKRKMSGADFGGEFWDEAVLCEDIRKIPAADVAEVRHGEWETVKGVLTPGGDPLKRCPYCKSRESEHLDGVEHPSRWMFCPICGAKMDGKGKCE